MGALDTYSGPWDERRAGHLLRRATFVTTRAANKQFAQMTLAQAVDTLLADKPAPSPPLDPASGKTWVNDTSPSPTDFQYRQWLKAWWMNLILQPGNTSVLEKMVLFWHNHFANESDVVNDSRWLYHQNALLRKYALGNFKELVKKISIDPAMLRYLNGDQNTAVKPNENYARELQELFTIGKGKEIAPGDYTTYTEDDVKAAARVLTGWRVSRAGDPSVSTFVPNLHDTKDKKFSHAYNNVTIKGRSGATSGMDEMNDLVDMILQQAETARYIVRKLYRWFVFYLIDNDVEENVIKPLAVEFAQNNFEVKPVLRKLLMSNAFFDEQNIGAMIKSPTDFLAGTANHFNFTLPQAPDQLYAQGSKIVNLGAALQQQIMEPPNVAGWQAYYQEPDFYKLWANSVTLPYRYGIGDAIVSGGGGRTLPATWTLDILAYIEQVCSSPSDPAALVSDLADDLIPAYPLTQAQREYLAAEVLMVGGQVYEWTTIWNDYKANPTNVTKKNAAQNRLQSLLRFVFRMAEYQLM